MSEGRARRTVYKRSEGRCEICGREGQSWHHRRNRSQGGLWIAENGLHLCGDGTRGCHGKMTNTAGFRRDYERNGWIVPGWLDPALVPALIVRPEGRVWCYLEPDGGVTVIDAGTAAAAIADLGLAA